MKNIRAKSVCVFRHQHKVLLTECFDPAKNQHYLMPIGGGVDFGEKSADAAIREVREEINAEICQLRLLGVIENLFTFNAQAGHEIVFVYEAEFEDQAFYLEPELTVTESDGQVLKARWFDYSHIHSEDINVYPNGIKGMLG